MAVVVWRGGCSISTLARLAWARATGVDRARVAAAGLCRQGGGAEAAFSLALLASPSNCKLLFSLASVSSRVVSLSKSELKLQRAESDLVSAHAAVDALEVSSDN